MTQPAEEPDPGPDSPDSPNGSDRPAAPAAPTAPEESAGSPAPPPQHVVEHTRLGAIWAGAIGFTVVLLLLLIFILENSQHVDVSIYGAHGNLPLGVALLLASVFGILLVVVPGVGRMVQLRLTARRHRRTDAAAGPPESPERTRDAGSGPVG